MAGDTEARHWAVRTRLSAMMFLFFFGLGAWVVTLSTYLMSAPIKGGLNFTTAQVGLIYSTFAFGGMAAPLSIGSFVPFNESQVGVLTTNGSTCSPCRVALLTTPSKLDQS